MRDLESRGKGRAMGNGTSGGVEPFSGTVAVRPNDDGPVNGMPAAVVNSTPTGPLRRPV
jgi:hypothetical protein